MANSGHQVLAVLSFLAFLVCASNAQLSPTFYSTSCPNLQTVVRSALNQALSSNSRTAASILRVFFHDCFVNGCDGSILLDGTAGEKGAFPNSNIPDGVFGVIDTIKTQVEANCGGVVSCADILALAARDGVVLQGGQSWNVPLGRRDTRTAGTQTAANNQIPAPSDNLTRIVSLFSDKGLTAADMTVLSGSHTIGQADCSAFRRHIWNETNIEASFATTRRANCPLTGGDQNLAPLDIQTPTRFDNNYFQNLVAQRGLLHSDQELFNNGSQDALVRTYSQDNGRFVSDFAAAMVKMGNISPLTGTQGEIRRNCRRPN